MLLLKIFQIIFLLFPFGIYGATQSDKKPQQPSLAPKNIDDLLLWGTYKPHLISAITQKSKYPITMGLAYSEFMSHVPSEADFKKSLRFRVRRDLLAQYSHHNGLDLAIQQVKDRELGLLYDLAFIEDTTSIKNGVKTGTEWIYLAEVSKIDDSNAYDETSKGFNTFIYLSLGDLEQKVEENTYIYVMEDKDNFSTLLEIKDMKKKTSKGFMRISILDDNGNISNDTTNNIQEIIKCATSSTKKKDTWKVEDVIYSHLTENEFEEIAYLDPAKCQDHLKKDNITFYLKQVIAKPKFKIVISFSPKSIPKPLDFQQLKQKIEKKKTEFEQEFNMKFPLTNINKFKVNTTEASEISRHALSNLLGGILYSYGKIRVAKRENDEPPSEELFTATPSRVGFPRGFLWDEGFHQSLICEWNTTLCIQMIKTWFNSIQEDGWIPREQARGDELESNFMQKDFLYQSQQEGNPPSMIIPILKLENKLYKKELDEEDSYEVYLFFMNIMPKLQLWFHWLARSQQNTNPLDGGNAAIFFRWMCKAPCNGKYFASGLDDYPRHPPGYHAVAQLDLHVWLATLAKGIIHLRKLFKEDTKDMENIYQSLLNTFEFFYDTNDNLPKDLIGSLGPRGEPNKRYRLINLGYVNLFPLFFGYEGNDVRLEAIIRLITSREHLWSDFGVRSLSKSDAFFRKGDNYWTEPIWIPMNYLLLRGLKSYYYDVEDAKELYNALRDNLIENMSANWKRTHNFWENYDSFNGFGKGFSSFTGWTSLMSLIYSEKYD